MESERRGIVKNLLDKYNIKSSLGLILFGRIEKFYKTGIGIRDLEQLIKRHKEYLTITCSIVNSEITPIYFIPYKKFIDDEITAEQLAFQINEIVKLYQLRHRLSIL